jgi:valyl-tRNA synthetase
MAKKRLYEGGAAAEGATYTLHTALLALLRLLAPIMPYITETIYQALFARAGASIHRGPWPTAELWWRDEGAAAAGELLVEIATIVRRQRSEAGLGLGAEVAYLEVAIGDGPLAAALRSAEADIQSVSRASEIQWRPAAPGGPSLAVTIGPLVEG